MLDAKINIVLRILSKVMFTEVLDEAFNHQTNFFSPCTNISIQSKEGKSIFEKHESAINLDRYPKKGLKKKLRQRIKESKEIFERKSKER